MKNNQQGFTLIELMIVVAIIAILAAIAIPAYNDYMRKARFSEVMAAGASYKLAVAECISDTGGLTGCSAGTNGIPAIPANLTDLNMDTMTVTDGVITQDSTTNAGDVTSILTPTEDGAVLIWAQSGTCATGTPVYCKE